MIAVQRDSQTRLNLCLILCKVSPHHVIFLFVQFGKIADETVKKNPLVSYPIAEGEAAWDYGLNTTAMYLLLFMNECMCSYNIRFYV